MDATMPSEKAAKETGDRQDIDAVPPARRTLGPLRMVFRAAMAYPGRVATAVVALIITALATLAIPAGFRLIIDRGFGDGGDPADIARWFEYLLMIICVLAIGTAVRFYTVSWLGERVVADIRLAVQRNLLGLAPSFFEENSPKEISSRMTADTAVVEQVVGTTVSVALRNAIMAVGGVIYLFALAPTLTLGLVIAIPCVVLPISWFGRRLRNVSRTSQDRVADIGAITEESGENYYVGDNVLFAIGQGLLSATPIQVVNAYGALANGGILHQPRVVRAVLNPGTRDRSSSLADLSVASVAERVSPAEPLRKLPMRSEVREPVIAGMRRVISGPGVTFDYYHKATGENLFRNFPLDELPLAGKTGTAQGFENLPWNDSSAFGAFSLNSALPYSAYAYLEKAGFGSQAAAPVVKCVFLALSGRLRMDELSPAEPVDVSSTLPAPPTRLRSPGCLIGSVSETRD